MNSSFYVTDYSLPVFIQSQKWEKNEWILLKKLISKDIYKMSNKRRYKDWIPYHSVKTLRYVLFLFSFLFISNKYESSEFHVCFYCYPTFFYSFRITLCVCNFLGDIDDEEKKLKQIWVKKRNGWKWYPWVQRALFPKLLARIRAVPVLCFHVLLVPSALPVFSPYMSGRILKASNHWKNRHADRRVSFTNQKLL